MNQRHLNSTTALRTLSTLGLFGALGVAGLTGCEVQDGLGWGDNGGTGTPPQTQPLPNENENPWVWDDEEPVENTKRYYAVYIEDLWDQRCATSASGAHGADIDAVGLWDPSRDPNNPELIAWLDIADHAFDSSVCDTYGAYDVDAALGAPDGDLYEGYYSLAGGWLIGEFDSQVEILDGYEITVHEIDDAFCGTYASCVGSERYQVYLATDLDCVNTRDFRDTCMVPLTGDRAAEGSIVLPVRLD